MPNSVYLGLDQSLTHIGVCIVNLATGRVITTTLLPPDHKHPIWERYDYITTSLLALCNYFKPEHIFLEEVYLGRNKNSAYALKAVRDLLCLVLYQNKLKFSIISASPNNKRSWPSLLGLTTTKEGIQKLVGVKLNKALNEHEKDAIGVTFGSLVGYNKVESLNIAKYEFYKTRPRKKLHSYCATNPKNIFLQDGCLSKVS